jgi:serine/threonine protein kinase
MNNVPPEPVKPPPPTMETLVGPTPNPLVDAFPETKTRLGDFILGRVLGEGGMGIVYLADDLRLGRKAAIKTMRPEMVAREENRLRFLREARAAAAIEHDRCLACTPMQAQAPG